MSVTITLLSGPGQGKVFRFDDSVDRIEIGRDPAWCQVAFPADFASVGRRHAGLRREMGHYVLVTNGRNPVILDGRQPFDNEPLGNRHEIALGEEGPRLLVETTTENALPHTTMGEKALTASAHAQKSRRRLWWIGGTCAVLIAGALSFLALHARQDALELRRIGEALSRNPTDKAPPPTTGVPVQALERAARSTYLVLIDGPSGQETAIATAWVVAPSLLATNAHVARLFDDLKDGQTLVVRSTVPPFVTHRVVGRTIHPDGPAFEKAWDSFSPIMSGSEVRQVQRAGDGYDVGLLRVDANVRLEPPLPIAPNEDLLALKPGDPLASIGFPMENLALGGVNARQPVPQVQRGFVTAISDYFLLPAPRSARHLLHHSVLSAGGSSGSPILDVRGNVVAVLSGGNIILTRTGRAPSAAGINFGQRADLLRELLGGNAPEPTAHRTQEWQRGLSTYGDPVKLILGRLVEDWKRELAAPETARRVGSLTGELKEELKPGMWGARIVDLIRQPGSYFVVAVSPTRSDLDMAILRGETVVKVDDSDDWYPALSVSQQSATPLDIVLHAEKAEKPLTFILEVWHAPPSSRRVARPPRQ